MVYVSDAGLATDAFASPDVTETLFELGPDRAVLLTRPAGAQKAVIGQTPANAMGALETLRYTFTTRRDRSKDEGGPAGESGGSWQLRLVHRAGSLEAAIGQSRHRNLAVSFGILALLGVSLGLIVFSTRRAAHLARQQVEFVAGVSHELRTPLSVINSAAENLSDGVVTDPAQIRRYGALIAGEGRRLNEMVEQVMTFAGLQAGLILGDRRTVGVDDLIDRALQASAGIIAQRQVQVERQVAPDLPAIDVDAAAIQRSLQNLIENAVKYSDGSPWLRVTAEPDGDGGGVAIGVEDHGLGIAVDEQRHIFEPFYRGPQVLASSVRGSGLGLSLVKRIVEAHGGVVTVKSAPGKGSRFVGHLPAGGERPS